MIKNQKQFNKIFVDTYEFKSLIKYIILIVLYKTTKYYKKVNLFNTK